MKRLISGMCGWASRLSSWFSPEPWRAPIRLLFGGTPKRARGTRALPAALANAVERIANLIGVANDFDEAGEWVQLAPLGDFPHSKGIQRVDRRAVEAMANHFNSLRAKFSRRFGGLPFFVGHPDVAGLANEYPDTKAYGWIMEVEAREDGLWGKPKWGEAGKQLLANAHYKFLSPHWNAEAATEGGRRVLRPVELVSVGLTNKPNLPVNPLANEQSNNMERAVLIALLGLANEATDEQIKTKITSLSNAVADAQTATANAETALTNERTAKSGIETQLTETKTKLTNAETALANERKARVDLLLANAVSAGRITEAQKPEWAGKFETDFAGTLTALENTKATVKTEARTGAMGGRRDSAAIANEQERRNKVHALVNEKVRGGMEYDAAFAAVKSEQTALFEAMHKPEGRA